MALDKLREGVERLRAQVVEAIRRATDSELLAFYGEALKAHKSELAYVLLGEVLARGLGDRAARSLK